MLTIITSDLHIPSPDAQKLNKTVAMKRFSNAIDFLNKIINLKPGVFIIAGDLLDYHYYGDDSKDKIINAFKNLKQAGIFCILVQGNHDLDFKLLNELEKYALVIASKEDFNHKGDIYIPVFKPVYDKRVIDKTAFHFVNYTESRDFLNRIEYERGKFNTLIMHSAVSGLKTGGNAALFGSLCVSDFKSFHHVFSGHIHQMQTQKNITYIGSPFLLNSPAYNLIFYETKTGKFKRAKVEI